MPKPESSTSSPEQTVVGEDRVVSHYRQLYRACGDALEDLIADERSRSLSESHEYLSVLREWINILQDRLEREAIVAGMNEYQFALLSLSLGLYRQSIMALRLFMELSLSGIYLSANEYELRRWLNEKKDISWAEISDEDTGLFSQSYVETFCKPLLGSQREHLRIAKKTYRECSQHVHGNPSATEILPDSISYNTDALLHWESLAQNVRLVVTYGFVLRYFFSLDSHERRIIEPQLLDELQHVEEARSLLA